MIVSVVVSKIGFFLTNIFLIPSFFFLPSSHNKLSKLTFCLSQRCQILEGIMGINSSTSSKILVEM
jgi:hypothetical protein